MGDALEGTPDRAVVVRDVTVQRGRRTILSGISVDACHGSILAILGPNGAGKTTLLETIAGFHAGTGQITIDGVALRVLSRQQRARRLAYVPQVSKLDAAIPVRAVVDQGRFAHRRGIAGASAADVRAVDEAMAATDTLHLATRAFTQISAGERRRVLIARALATGARIMLLDEPSAALDIAQSLSMFALLRRLADQGCSILVILHQLDEAMRCADQALLLHEGRVEIQGATREVIAPDPVRRVYGVDLVPGGGLGYQRAPQS